MPKLIRDNPAYFIVPVFILIIGAVFFLADWSGLAKEWEKAPAPAGHTQGRLNNLATYLDLDNNKFYAWAVGGEYADSNDSNLDVASIYSYDSQNGYWTPATFSWPSNPSAGFNETKLNSIFSKVIGGDNYLWAVGDNGLALYYNGTDWEYECGSYPCNPSSPMYIFDNSSLTDVFFVNKNDGWATGYKGQYGSYEGVIYQAVNSGLPTGSPGWTKKIIYDENTISMNGSPGHPYPAPLLAVTEQNNIGWAVGANNEIYKNTGAIWKKYIGTNFKSFIPNGNCITGFCDNMPDLKCETAPETWENDCKVDFKDIFFTTDGKGFIPISNKRYLYKGGLDWELMETDRPAKEPEIKMYGVSGGLAGGHPYIWFTGADGMIIFSPNTDTVVSGKTHWLRESTPAMAGGQLNAVNAVNSYNVMSVGSSPAGLISDNVILKLSSGNTSGYAYIGADDCENFCLDTDKFGKSCQDIVGCPVVGQTRTAPLGWISFNSINEELNEQNIFSYGVSLKKEIETTDPDKSCVNMDTDHFQDDDVGALSGYAWVGEGDPPVGWLSFNRTDTGNPPEEPYKDSTITTPCGKSIDTSDPALYERYAMAFFNYQNYALKGWGQFKIGQCSNNLAISCFAESAVSDCGGAGTCIYKNGSAEGWLKLRGGKNFSADNLPSNPPPEITASGSHYIYKNCNACTLVNPNLVTAYMTCKICDGLNIDSDKPGENYACNKCEGSNQCGDGRCSNDLAKVCVQNLTPGLDPCVSGGGECKPSGYCSAGTNQYSPCIENVQCTGGKCQRGYCSNKSDRLCYDNTDCPAISPSDPPGTCQILNPVSCNKCASCDAYGVSVDINGGNFYGYARSEDFGWVDMSRVTMGGTAWLQTLYGDIYGQKGVGTEKTAKAPGYNTKDSACNATYLILAGNPNEIVNFCSSTFLVEGNRNKPSTITPQVTDTNPWLVKKYRTFTLPKASAPNSILGRVDYNQMITRCDPFSPGGFSQKGNTTLDKKYFGDDFVLNGKTICVADIAGGQKGNLTISANGLLFDNGTLLEPDGSGLFVVDGDLYIQGNIGYESGAGVSSLKQLASVGFYVKGDIIISASVNSIVGAYYAEGKIVTQSMGSSDKMLEISGLMIAKEFNFGRRNKGTISAPEPAELIKYDGRVQLNPPPGFRDLSRALPKISEVSP